MARALTDTPSKKTRAREPVAWLALAGLGIWDLNDATGPKAVPQASLFLGIVAALFLVAVVRRLRSRAVLPHAPLFLVGGCFAVGIAMIPFRPDYHPEYVLSDLGTLAFFVLCLVLAALYREELTSHRTVVLFVALYIVIALVAYYAAVTDLRPEYWWNGRWDPPYYMLFGGLALLARYTDSLPKRLVSSYSSSPCSDSRCSRGTAPSSRWAWSSSPSPGRATG